MQKFQKAIFSRFQGLKSKKGITIPPKRRYLIVGKIIVKR